MQMDNWLIGNKAVILLYVISSTFFHNNTFPTPELTLAYLLYLCMNIAIPIFKRKWPRQALALLSMMALVYWGAKLDAVFLLLLPVNLCEFADPWPAKWRNVLILAVFVPVWVSHKLQMEYVMVAGLTLLLYANSRIHFYKVSAAHEEQERFNLDLLRLTKQLAEKNEFLRQSEYTIKLEERNQLSQQIHDEIGHAMAGALIQMEASRRMMERDLAQASTLLGNAIAISKEGLERIRLTLKNLKPPMEQLGVNRLQLFVDELSATHNITAVPSYAGDLDVVTPIQWKIIQENATEAVTNALKYAAATTIQLEVRVLNKFVKSVVIDNGKGEAKIVKGLGIAGMEERAASVKGTVIVDGTHGFSVTTLLPID